MRRTTRRTTGFAFAPIALFLLVPALAAGAEGPEAKSPPDSSGAPQTTHIEMESTSVPMDMSYGKPIVSAKVNGRGPYRFFLDSAAGGTVLDSAFAAELSLVPRGTVTVGDPAKPNAIQARAYTIDKLQIGNATFTNFEAVAFDRSKLYPKSDAPKGVIGFPLFRDALLTFDYPNEVARIAHGAVPRVGAVDALPFAIKNGIPVVMIDVAGRKLEAHLDSGSPGTLMLPASLQDSIPLLGPLRELGKGRTVAGEYTFMGGELAQPFKFGTHAFDSLTVRFAPGFTHANVGSGILKSYAVTFDQKRARVRLAYGGGARQGVVKTGAGAGAAVPDTSGLASRPFGLRMHALENGNLQVTGVDPGSPAEATGVVAGDIVIGVDGKAVSVMRGAEIKEVFAKKQIMLNVRRGDKRYGYTLMRAN